MELTMPTVVVIAIINLVIGGYIFFIRRSLFEFDRRFTETKANILELENDLLNYEERRNNNCKNHSESIRNIELELGKRKGENELLGKDIQRLDETVNLKLKNITETQNEIKSLIEKLHAEILIISKNKK
jgi:hypothetical protein